MTGHQEIFVQATQLGAPYLGHYGEVSEMIEKDLTLVKAAALHKSNWGLIDRTHIQHDLNHVIFAMLLHTHPELIAMRDYQGTVWAESYVTTMQLLLVSAYDSAPGSFSHDKDAFVADVINRSLEGYSYENENRILSWLIAKKLENKTAFDVFKACRFDAKRLVNKALDCGIRLDFSKIRNEGIGRIASPEHGCFVVNGRYSSGSVIIDTPASVELPAGFSDESLKIFNPIEASEAGAFYDALVPVIHFIQQEIYKFRAERAGPENPEGVLERNINYFDLYERIKISDVVAVLRHGNKIGPPEPREYTADLLTAEM